MLAAHSLAKSRELIFISVVVVEVVVSITLTGVLIICRRS